MEYCKSDDSAAPQTSPFSQDPKTLLGMTAEPPGTSDLSGNGATGPAPSMLEGVQPALLGLSVPAHLPEKEAGHQVNSGFTSN